jgi:hypothetical protein
MDFPTDRLFKFLTLAGAALVTFGITVSLEKFNAAELQRIELRAKLSEQSQVYEDFAKNVNSMDAVMRRIEKLRLANASKADIEKEMDRFPRFQSESDKLYPNVQRVELEVKKHLDLAGHLETMRNWWFFICGVSTIAGLLMVRVGLREWLRQPLNKR